MDSYVIMLYTQPDDFAPPSEFAGNDMPVGPMNWNEYVTVRSQSIFPMLLMDYHCV